MTKADSQAPGPSARLTLREVTAETVRAVAALEVAPDQQHLVANNALSMAEASVTPGAWFRAVYADETPVGFVLLFDPTLPGAKPYEPLKPGDAYLWRFMMDHRFQGHGYGQLALDLVRAYLRTRPGIERLIASFVPGEQSPRRFYLSYGFRETGRLVANDTEVEICLVL